MKFIWVWGLKNVLELNLLAENNPNEKGLSCTFSCWGIILRLFLRRFQRFETFQKISEQRKFSENLPIRFWNQTAFFLFLVQFSGFLTWWFSRDQAEEIEADWELRKDKFYSESAASGYTNEALNLSIDDFGKKPMCSKFW